MLIDISFICINTLEIMVVSRKNLKGETGKALTPESETAHKAEV